ncbi:tRNA pseudouridine(55) synthase TruB [candidate division FCPU426 bacterium]|nr:tRNA pseudouridine(55) synthase TruB [candidate division FCPU426 bacterium]
MPSGFLPLIKPVGPTSAAVVGRIRRLSRMKRVGHAGTLDPPADGVLTVALQRATQLIPYLPGDKTYRAVIRLGSVTDTLDASGKVLQEFPVPRLTSGELAAVLEQFCGAQYQRPPLISARHYQGKRLYQWARQGKPVALPATPITIHALTLVSWQTPDVECEVTCSRGTYIRSLARDLGEKLDCAAHLLRLTRTACSGFFWDEALPAATWEEKLQPDRLEACLVSCNHALRHLPEYPVDRLEQKAVQNGRPLPAAASRMQGVQTPYRIVNAEGRLLAVARFQEGWLKMERVLYAAGEANQ